MFPHQSYAVKFSLSFSGTFPNRPNLGELRKLDGGVFLYHLGNRPFVDESRLSDVALWPVGVEEVSVCVGFPVKTEFEPRHRLFTNYIIAP